MTVFIDLGLVHAKAPETDDDAFELQAALNAAYGFDSDAPPDDIDARCVAALVLVFNEFHETDPDDFRRRLGRFAKALGVTLPHLDVDEYEVVEGLIEAMNEALEGDPRQCYGVGEDCYATLLVRDALPARLTALGEPL